MKIGLDTAEEEGELVTYLLTWIQSSVTDKQQLLLLTRDDAINHNHRNQAAKSGSSVARHHHHHVRRHQVESVSKLNSPQVAEPLRFD